MLNLWRAMSHFRGPCPAIVKLLIVIALNEFTAAMFLSEYCIMYKTDAAVKMAAIITLLLRHVHSMLKYSENKIVLYT